MINNARANKNVSQSEACHLHELEEARGQLLRIFEAEGQIVGVWDWGCCSFPLELREKLTALVGHKIAVLRLDGKFHIRSLDEEAEDAA